MDFKEQILILRIPILMFNINIIILYGRFSSVPIN